MPTPPVFPFKKITHIGFGLMVLMILATLGVSLWGLHQTVDIFESVIHTEEVSDELLRIYTNLKEAEDQQREYLLTGNAQRLAPYHQAIERTHAGLMTLEGMAMSQSRRDRMFPDFKHVILHRLDLLQQILDLRDTQGSQTATERIRAGEGMQLTAKIRQQILAITGSLSPGGKEIFLSFEDTGRGMSPDVLRSLFTYQVVSRKPGGTGLGTKIVKDVIDSHGGTIRAESTEGQGTTFTICLPIERPAVEA